MSASAAQLVAGWRQPSSHAGELPRAGRRAACAAFPRRRGGPSRNPERGRACLAARVREGATRVRKARPRDPTWEPGARVLRGCARVLCGPPHFRSFASRSYAHTLGELRTVTAWVTLGGAGCKGGSLRRTTDSHSLGQTGRCWMQRKAGNRRYNVRQQAVDYNVHKERHARRHHAR